eukprot:scaffold7773_cov258-Pinguiococcus_pyrenoidosus.AAC.2
MLRISLAPLETARCPLGFFAPNPTAEAFKKHRSSQSTPPPRASSGFAFSEAYVPPKAFLQPGRMSSKQKFSLSALAALPEIGFGDLFANAGSDSDSNDEEELEQLGLIVQQISAMKATKERQQRLQTKRAKIEAHESNVVSSYEKRLAASKAKLKAQEEALKKSWSDLRSLDKKHEQRNEAILAAHKTLSDELVALTQLNDAIERQFEGAVESAGKELAEKCAEKVRELQEMAAGVGMEE